jgi:hypothetical protein
MQARIDSSAARPTLRQPATPHPALRTFPSKLGRVAPPEMREFRREKGERSPATFSRTRWHVGEGGFARAYVERTGSGRSRARMAMITKAAPPRMVKIEAIPCTAMPAAATASSEPTPVGVLRAAP